MHDVAVIGVPHDEMGEQVKSLIPLADALQGSRALATELIDYVRHRRGFPVRCAGGRIDAGALGR